MNRLWKEMFLTKYSSHDEKTAPRSQKPFAATGNYHLGGSAGHNQFHDGSLEGERGVAS
jgi:hypothetical protein